MKVSVTHRSAQSYVKILCILMFFVCKMISIAHYLAHICLLLVSYDLIQPNLQTDSEICAERGLIELKDFTYCKI